MFVQLAMDHFIKVFINHDFAHLTSPIIIQLNHNFIIFIAITPSASLFLLSFMSTTDEHLMTNDRRCGI